MVSPSVTTWLQGLAKTGILGNAPIQNLNHSAPMIFKITSPLALKFLAAYAQPKYASYFNLIKPNFGAHY